MNGYTDTQLLIVKRIQADRRAEAAADRLTGEWRRTGPPRPRVGPGGGLRAAAGRLVLTTILVVLGIGAMAGAGMLLGTGVQPVEGPTPGLGA